VFRAETPLFHEVVASPVTDGHVVYIAGDGEVRAYDLSSGLKALWSLRSTDVTIASPVLVGGHLFVAYSSELKSINVRTGRVEASTFLDESLIASPVVFGTYMYLVTVNGALRALHLPDLSIVRTISIPGNFYASPALARGRLVLRSTTDLVCLR
jgi:hypothetical protein